MKIKITADSTCDLSEALLRQWDISLMPMHILMGGESYLDGITVRPADVFAHVEAGGQTPKSAAANPVEYIDFFGPFAKEYDAVIHISVSAKLSSCYQNACLAAQEYDNVSVIDSENICTGQGYLVLRAAKWAADGLTARNICMRLQNLAKRVELSFVLDQLNYMAKSGRCSGVLAFGANLLGIKPSLAVIDGELKVVKKYRGSLPICVGKYITDLLDGLTEEKTAKFLTMLSDLGHASPIEHASFTFGIEGVSRTLLAQITRHRIASFSVQSQRYVRLDDFHYVIPPEIEAIPEAKAAFLESMDEDAKRYLDLAKKLEDGHTARLMAEGMPEKQARAKASKQANEDARFVLPNACETKMVVTMNARSLQNFFHLRCCSRAQWEIRQLAEEMFRLVYPVAPHIFAKAGPACVSGPCPEGKMCCGRTAEVRAKYEAIKQEAGV